MEVEVRVVKKRRLLYLSCSSRHSSPPSVGSGLYVHAISPLNSTVVGSSLGDMFVKNSVTAFSSQAVAPNAFNTNGGEFFVPKAQ